MDFKLTREQEDLQERVRALVRRKIAPRATDYDREGRFPRENFEDLHKAKLLGLLIPQEFGGLEADMLTYTLVIEEIAKGCGSTALIYAMHCGATRAVALGGTPVQKNTYLPAVTEQGEIFAWGFSEPGSGGNILKPQLVGKLVETGYLLNGVKAFCTGAGHVDYYLINTQAEDAAHFMQSQNFFVIDAQTEGLRVEETWDALGMRANCSNTVFFKECTLPAFACLGGHGSGMTILTQTIPPLILGLAAASLGVATAAFDFALDHTANRIVQPANKPLSSFQGVRFMLADMQVALHTARLALQQAAWLADRDIFEAFMPMNMAKFVCNKHAIEVTGTAMQVCGGHGYLKKNPLERYFRDARAGAVMGANLEVLRDMIAKSALGIDPRQEDV